MNKDNANLFELALYLTNQGASQETPDQVWAQLHQPFGDSETTSVAELLEELGFEYALTPGMYYLSFTDRANLAATANQLLEAAAELPIRFQLRICLPHEGVQIFLSDRLLSQLVG